MMRRYLEAIGLFERLAETLPTDDALALSSRHGIAVIYVEQKRLTEAARLLRDVVAARGRVIGADDLDTLESMNFLA